MYYDVMNMDACHLLFGRPWRCNVIAQYTGRENMYRLEKNGVKFTLLPLQRMNHSKASKVEGYSFLTITQFEKDLFPFHQDDFPLYPYENSRSTSLHVEENDAK